MKYSALYATSKWAQVASHNQVLIRHDDGRVIKQSRLRQASPWRATLEGLIEAISGLPEGSHVKLITDLDMGVGRLERSINHDLKRLMVETLKGKSCTFEFLNVECANSLWDYIDAA
jgi:hypothetical protein